MSQTRVNKISHNILGLLLAGLVFAITQNAQAALVIRVDDPLTGTNPDILVADGDVADLFGGSGMVTIADSMTNGQTVSISAVSVPLLGSDPKLDLVTLTISGPTSGILEISATNTDFTLPPSGDTEFFASIGGTTDGSVSAKAYVDSGNAEFGTSTLIHDFGTFFGPAFSDTSSSILPTPFGPFSMSLLVEVDHDDPFDVTSFDFIVNTTEASNEQSTPEPTSLTLGLIGLAALSGSIVKARRSKRGK